MITIILPGCDIGLFVHIDKKVLSGFIRRYRVCIMIEEIVELTGVVGGVYMAFPGFC